MSTINGTDGDDSLTGTEGNDQIFGGAGNDTLHGATPDFVAGARLQGMAGALNDQSAQIIALPGGGYVVAWSGASSDGQANDIFVQRFHPDGTEAGAGIRLQGMPGFSNLTDTNPDIATLADGGFAVSWQGVSVDGQGWDIFVQRFGPDGNLAGGTARLQGMNGTSDFNSSITVLPDGGYVVAWHGDTTDGQGSDVFVQRFEADGSAAGSPARLQGMAGNLGDANAQTIALSDGGYVVTWQANTSDDQSFDIFVQRFDAEGGLVGGASRLQGMEGALADQFPQIAALDGGGYVVTWQGVTSDNQGNDIFVQRFDAAGDPAGGPARLQGMAGNLTDSAPQVVALPGGGYAVAWSGVTADGQGSDIFVQRFNPDGSLAGPAARLQGMAGGLADTAPQIVALPDGGYAVTWTGGTADGQGTDIFVQRFNPDGTLSGGTDRAQGMPGALADGSPRIAALSDGTTVVGWSGATSDGQGGDIFVQRFAGQGGDDTIQGGDGDDVIFGGNGADALTGDAGDDLIDGGAGDDTILGGDGADTITGGAGNDLVFGGSGRDVFRLGNGFGADTIGDFDMADSAGDGQTDDRVDLSGYTVDTGSGPRALRRSDLVLSQDADGNAIVTFPGGETITFTGVAPAAMDTKPEAFAMGLPCFVRGTPILTPAGERPVERIAAGDLVLTRDRGACRVIWAGARALGPGDLALRPDLRPVHFDPGAIGNRLPLRLSPQHAVVMRLPDGTEALVRARHLAGAGHPGIRVARGVRAVTYHHLLLERHAILIAAGALAESLYPGPEAMRMFDPATRRAIAEAILGARSTPATARPDPAMAEIAAAYGPRSLALATRTMLTGRRPAPRRAAAQ